MKSSSKSTKAEKSSIRGPVAEQMMTPTGHRPLNILVLSPFSPWPQDAGQRKRVHQTLRLMKDLGFSVTLLLYAFEGAWGWRYQTEAIAHLREEHEDILLLPATPIVGMPPKIGDHHGLDEWWDPLLEQYIIRLLEIRHFDAIFVNNVWLSKALTLVPPSVVKILDTHDIFHLRDLVYQQNGVTPEFFRIRDRDELFGIERADICMSISLPEARYLADLLDGSRIIYLPYAPVDDEDISEYRPRPNPEYLHPDKVVFGFIGTSHTFNVSGLRALLQELAEAISATFAPIEILIAGSIGDALGGSASRIRFTVLGWVEQEEEFYDSIDYFVVPVFNGTGFKVKVADILQRGKPALFASHSVEGLAIDRTQIFPDAKSMARAMSQIAFSRPPLAHYTAAMEKSWRLLGNSVSAGLKSLMWSINQQVIELIVDLRGQAKASKPLILLSVFTLAREAKDNVRTRILVSEIEPWLATAASYLSPSITLETVFAADGGGEAMPNRIWWRFAGGDPAIAREMVAADLSLTDMRFGYISDKTEILGDLVLSPDQAIHAHMPSNVNWLCLPYLVESTKWDPASRVIFRQCWTTSPAELEPDKPEWPAGVTIILVDDEHERTIRLQSRIRLLGVTMKIVDLRNTIETGRLLAALYNMMDRGAGATRIVDGCSGKAPLRSLVLDMAILAGVPASTAAFGAHQDISGVNLTLCQESKRHDDEGSYRNLIRRFVGLGEKPLE